MGANQTMVSGGSSPGAIASQETTEEIHQEAAQIMTSEEIIQRGHDAEVLLQNGLLNTVFATIENDCLKTWRETPIRDTEARERVWFIVKYSDAVRLELNRLVSEAKLAKAMVDEENRKREFEKTHGVRPPSI